MRISQLPSANLPIDPNDLVLVDQQNPLSPSGFTTRKTGAGNIPSAPVTGLRADLANTSDLTKGVSLIGGAARVVTSIANLRLLPKTGGSIYADVLGYYAPSDGGGGQYYYDSTDTTSPDDGGSVIVAGDGGRWKLCRQAVVSAKQFGAKGDGAFNNSTVLQNWLDYISSNTDGSGMSGYLPGTSSVYLIGAKLRIKKTYFTIFGDGRHQTTIYGPGIGAGIIVADAITYVRPNIKGMTLLGTFNTGAALDFSAVTGQVYFGRLENLYLVGGTAAGIYAPGTGVYPSGTGQFFSMLVEDVVAASFGSHAFHFNCGPGVKLSRLEALTAGAGKAGFRLAGLINMQDCNGVYPTTSPAASCDVWACFGLDNTASDGFQNDFPFTDYPQVYMKNCNVEDFGTATVNGIGILLHNSYYDFHFDGGKFDRSSTNTAFKAYVYARNGPAVSGATIRLAPSRVFLSSPSSPSLAHLYCERGAIFEDTNGVLASVGITTYVNTNDGPLTYPTIKTYKVTNDVYGEFALSMPAIKPRRITAQVIRYDVLALTPAGANQAIDVTGFTRVKITPAAPASVSTAIFDQTIGAGVDYLRNGELIVEVGNGNLTIVHSSSGANSFYLAGGANITPTAGQIIRFTWSEVNSNWVQIGNSSASSGETFVSIFHNSLLDIWGANDPAVGPPSGVTCPGSAVKETVTYWPGNQSLQSVKLVSSGTTIGNGCTFTPVNQPWGGPPGPSSVSVTIPIYSLSATRFWVVHGYDGTTYTLLGQTAAVANSWSLIKGTFTPAPGSTWTIVVSFWDGSTFYSGFQCYLGGINVVRGAVPADTIEETIARRNFTVFFAGPPTRAPDFTGERWWDSANSKFYMSNGNTNVSNWVVLN